MASSTTSFISHFNRWTDDSLSRIERKKRERKRFASAQKTAHFIRCPFPAKGASKTQKAARSPDEATRRRWIERSAIYAQTAAPATRMGDERMLTSKQKQLLDFIAKEIAENGRSPNFLAMMDAVGARSRSVVNKLLTDLEDRKFIRRYRWRHNGVEILKMPMLPAVRASDGFAEAYAMGFRQGYQAALDGDPMEIPGWAERLERSRMDRDTRVGVTSDKENENRTGVRTNACEHVGGE